MRLEFIGSCIIFSSVMLAVIDRNRNVEALTAGAAGLSITYALSVSSVTSQVFHQPVVVAYTSF